MRVLVVGGGGREHALVWKLSQSPLSGKIFCAPGNPGIASLAECVPIAAGDIKELLAFACREKIDLTVVGPEIPLVEGITDLFSREGLLVFGPSQAAAKLEGSKVFAKELLEAEGIPTASFETFSDPAAALSYLREQSYPLVLKAEGLAAGKGVIIVQNQAEAEKCVQEIMVDKVFGAAGDRLVVEEFLTGEEASLLAFTDGKLVVPLPPAQDHKAVFDNDLGPNTGGMGAYAPAPVMTPELISQVVAEIIRPVVAGLAKRGIEYRGILYAGLMITATGPKVLEFNVRFGDPEAQAVIPLIKSDLLPVLMAVARGKLEDAFIEWHEGSSACVVMASGGYPRAYDKGLAIQGLEEAAKIPGVTIFHAGTAVKEGQVVTAGGRVLGVTGRGKSLKEALAKAYQGINAISFSGCHYRSDIGRKGLHRRGYY